MLLNNMDCERSYKKKKIVPVRLFTFCNLFYLGFILICFLCAFVIFSFYYCIIVFMYLHISIYFLF